MQAWLRLGDRQEDHVLKARRADIYNRTQTPKFLYFSWGDFPQCHLKLIAKTSLGWPGLCHADTHTSLHCLPAHRGLFISDVFPLTLPQKKFKLAIFIPASYSSTCPIGITCKHIHTQSCHRNLTLPHFFSHSKWVSLKKNWKFIISGFEFQLDFLFVCN